MKGMQPFAEQLTELQERCDGEYSFTEEDRVMLHNAYWNGSAATHSWVLELICYDPSDEDMPVLLDASSPTSDWVLRCSAAEALGQLDQTGAPVLRLMLSRETHYTARFYILRELIDLEDEVSLPFLDGPIPPNSSPSRRSLWIYGNFEREELTKDKALSLGAKLFEHRKGFHNWLRDHLEASELS